MINYNMNTYKKSPAYFGKNPTNLPIGTIDTGFDDLLWYITNKNGRHVWIRKTDDTDIINNELNNISNKSNINTSNSKNDKGTKKKYTLYNEYLEIKMKELKETHLNISPKELFNMAVQEWHIIKKNKTELNNYLSKI
jgi:hypothetical protein